MPQTQPSQATSPCRRGNGLTWTVGVLAFAGLGAGAAWSMGLFGARGAGANGSGARPAASEYAAVTKASFDINTIATGELRAKEETTIRSLLEAESTIVQVINEGTFAKKGDLLIELNSDQIKTQIDEETLRVESARSDLVAAENAYEIQLSENASKLRQAQLKVDLAVLAQKQWESGELVQKRKDNEVDLDKAARDLSRLKKKFEESRKLLENGFLSQNEFELDEIAKLEAEAALEKAKLAQETYEKYQFPKDQKSKQSDVDEASAELDRTKQQNEIQRATKDADRNNKRRQLQVREEKLKKLETQFVNTKLFAPQDGLVVYATSMNNDNFMMGNDQGPLKVGRRVWPNETLILLPDTSAMVANVRVHEALAGRIRKGQRASIRVDAVGGKSFAGEVDSIGVLAESGGWRDPNRREYTVKILLDEFDRSVGLKPSMRCEAQVLLEQVRDVLSVPVQAIFREDPVRYVYVPENGRLSRVPVRVGRQSDTFAEIVVGLDEGTKVALRDPKPGEALAVAWNEAQLKTVGLKLGDDGKPVGEGGGMGGPGGRNGGGRPGGMGGRQRGPGNGPPNTPGTNQDAPAQPTAAPGGLSQGRPHAPGDVQGEKKPEAGTTHAAATPAGDAPAPGSPAEGTQPTDAPAQAPSTGKDAGKDHR